MSDLLNQLEQAIGVASKLWNDQPIEKRKELRGILSSHRIRDLKMQRKAMQAAMRKAISQIDELIKHEEAELVRWEREQSAIKAGESE